MAEELTPIEEPIPDPPKANDGTVAKAMGYVEQARQSTTQVLEGLKQHEKVQKVSEYTKQKATEVQDYAKRKYDEDERLKKVVDKTWEKTEQISEKTKEVAAKAGEYAAKASEKTKELSAKTVEKTRDSVAKTKTKTQELWAKGKGKITKIRAEAGWGASAQETLLARKEASERWTQLKIRGADDITIGARKEFTTAYFVEKGTLMHWSFRVKDHDVGFGVRLRVMQDGGSREEDVLPLERFDNTDTVEGSWVADEDRTMVLVFDNTYSKLRSKTVAYLVGTEKPEAGKAEEVGEASTELGEASCTN